MLSYCCDIRSVIRNIVATLFLCLISTATFSLSRNDGSIQNEGIIRIDTQLHNAGVIHNHNRITGTGIITHEGRGEIRNYAEFRQYQPDPFYEGFVTPAGSTVKEQVAADIGCATYYELVNRKPDEAAARRFFKFQAAIIDETVTLDRARVTPVVDYSVITNPANLDVAILHNTASSIPVDTSSGNIHVYPSFFGIEGYSGRDPYGDYIAPNTDRRAIIRQLGGRNAVYHGDNSWFNGAFILADGSATLLESGKMFGGDVDILPTAILTWQGGDKDEFNTPNVTISPRAELIFKLPTGANSIFSLYGTISGNPDPADPSSIPKVTFSSGTVYVKGDCSGFRGDVTIRHGSNFVIKKSDAASSSRYEGKMFGGRIIILDESGSPGGEISVKSNSGITPMHITNGVVNIVDDDTKDLPGGSQTIDTLEIDSGAKVNVGKRADSIFENATVKGELEISAGNNTLFKNMTVDKGTLNLSSPGMTNINVSGTFTIGSTINALGTNACTKIRALETVGGVTFTQIAGRPLDVYCCVDPSNNDSFRMIFDNAAGIDTSIVMQHIHLLTPMVDDVFIFQVLQLTDPGAAYPLMQAAPGLIIEGAGEVGLIGTPVDNARNGLFMIMRTGGRIFVKGLTTHQLLALNNVYVPLKNMHATGISNINDMLGAISDSRKERRGKEFWNISYTDSSTYRMKKRDMESDEYTSILGYDSTIIPLKYGISLMPTAFGGYSVKNLTMPPNKNAKQNTTIAGCKLSFFKENTSLDFSYSYGILRTKMESIKYGNMEMKSHMFCFGSKLQHIFNLTDSTWITSGILLNYANCQTHTEEKVKLGIKNAPTDVLFLNPSLSFSFKYRKNIAELGAKWHGVAGGKIKTSVIEQEVKINGDKKGATDLFINFKTRLKHSIEAELNFTKTVGNKNGIKGSFTLSIPI